MNEAPLLLAEAAHSEAAEVLTAGGVVVLPTDTVYGVAALASQAGAIDRIYELKQRPSELAIAVLVADSRQATELVDLSDAERMVADQLWPGALTLVMNRRPSADARLGRDDGTVGIRAPAGDFVRHLAEQVGPLATTSANLSGQPTATTAVDAAASLAGSVDLIVDGGRLDGAASTVARVHENRTVTVFRPGPLTQQQIERAAAVEKSG